MPEKFDGAAIARQRIAEEAERRTGFLDLSELGLTELPTELFELRHLRRLHLGWRLVGEGDDWQAYPTNDPNNRIAGQFDQLARLSELQALSICGTDCDSLAPLAALRDLHWLDCSSTQVADLGPLAGLTALQSLTCWSTQVADLGPLAGLTALQSLDCSETQVAGLGLLTGLTALQSLDCWSTQVADLGPLAGLTALQSLDCNYTQVADLGPLAGLTALQSLDCSETQVADLGPLAGLTALQSLDCSFTQVADLGPLAGLTALQSLNCRGTQVVDLGPLAGLTALQSLHCWSTQVADLGPLAGLTALQSLSCSETQVAGLGPLTGLTALQSLDCSSTQVADLGPLAGLTALQSLDCSKCNLSSSLESIWFLPSLRELKLYETPIPGVPPEALSQSYGDNCLDSLRAHLRDQAAEAATITDAKLLVLGNGRAGKTQLARQLRHDPFQDHWDSTHGIRVTAAALPATNGGPDTHLNIWDFGGQDIYHGTHALFVRSRAVFLLAWATDTEKPDEYEHQGIIFRNHPLLYWVEYVHNVGDAHSPVLLVQTKCDEQTDIARRLPVEPEALEALGWCETLHYSARFDRPRAALDEALRNAVAELRARQGVMRIGAGRLRVQRRIEALRNPDGSLPPKYRMLTRATFAAWCRQARGVSSADALLHYLHNAGVLFYRKGLFQDRIVLDQAWALNAIYTVFDRTGCYQRLRREGGKFDRARLAELVWQQHPVEEQRLFLSMMRSCGICFVWRSGPRGVEDDDTIYIAPDLLPEREAVQIELDDRWGIEPPAASVSYDYPLLHRGLMRGVIARVGNQAGLDAVYWRDGVYVYETTTRSRALIEQEMPPGGWRGTVRLHTKGGQAEALLQRLAGWIEEENSRLGLHPTVAGGEPAPSRAAPLRTAPALAFAAEPGADFDCCVSYAWGDDTPEGREREAIVDRLCAEAARRGRRILRDRTAMGIGDRIPDFMRSLATGQRVFVVLSDKYLRSPNCMFELHEIWRNSRLDDAEFLRRIRVFKLPEVRIGRFEERKIYQDWWDAELAKQQAVVGEFTSAGKLHRLERDLPDFVAASKFADQVLAMLKVVSETLLPGTWEDFLHYGFDDAPRS